MMGIEIDGAKTSTLMTRKEDVAGGIGKEIPIAKIASTTITTKAEITTARTVRIARIAKKETAIAEEKDQEIAEARETVIATTTNHQAVEIAQGTANMRNHLLGGIEAGSMKNHHRGGEDMMMIDLREEGIGIEMETEMEDLIVLLVVDVYIRSSLDIQNITVTALSVPRLLGNTSLQGNFRMLIMKV